MRDTDAPSGSKAPTATRRLPRGQSWQALDTHLILQLSRPETQYTRGRRWRQPSKKKILPVFFRKKIVPALRHTKRQHGPRQGFVWGHVCNFARILLVLDFCSHPPLVGYLPRSCMGQNTSIWRISMMTLPTTLPIPISFVE